MRLAVVRDVCVMGSPRVALCIGARVCESVGLLSAAARRVAERWRAERRVSSPSVASPRGVSDRAVAARPAARMRLARAAV
jgi:hypothetical protein